MRVAIFSAVILLAMAVQPAIAETMACGQYMIQGGETEPAMKDEIVEKCGEPTSKDGNNWIYKRQGQNTKILHFNDNGGLESISERVGD